MSDKTETQLPTEGGSSPRSCSLLAWKPDPDRPRVILGSSRLAPEITLYIIELMDGRDDRGHMSGAFIPDEFEKEGLYQRALVHWLKWEAESMMAEFLATHSPANAIAVAPPTQDSNEETK